MGARPLLRKGTGESLWVQMLADLRRRMTDGEFVEAFPGGLALAREYDFSRHTAREAVGRLRREGAVPGARGRTPRVLPPAEIQQPLGALYSLFASVEQAGQEERSIVQTLDLRADGVMAAHLGLEESTPLRALVPTPAERGLLDLNHTDTVAVLAFDRLGCSHGQPVEWRHTIVRGDRFSVTATFPQHDTYQLASTP